MTRSCRSFSHSYLLPLTGRLSFRRSLQLGDIELLHLQHRFHRPVGFPPVRIAQQLDHPRRHHLPGQPELVLDPATLLRLGITTLAELVPVVVHLFLVSTHDLKRDRFGELELGAAIQSGERLSVELELDGENLARRLPMDLRPSLRIPTDPSYFRVLEDTGIKPRRVFGLAVEPETGSDRFAQSHGCAPCLVCATRLLLRPKRIGPLRLRLAQ